MIYADGTFAQIPTAHDLAVIDAREIQEQNSIARLEFLDQESIRFAREIEELKYKIIKENSVLKELSRKEQRIQEKLEAEEDQLTLLLRQVFLAGPISKARLWLSPYALHSRDRLIEYHNRVLDERRTVIEKYESKLQQQRDVRVRQTELIAVLEDLKLDQKRKRQNLQLAKDQTQLTLKRIRTTRKALYKKISLQDRPAIAAKVPFAQMRGALSVPIKGKIQERFGKKHVGGLIWHGWEIEPQMRQAVHAIHDGTILFMQRNELMGLLIVIDHGDNYLSLYAHNNKALKEIGDPVYRGESIAVIEKTSVLYFGLLLGETPLDPKPWLQI